MDWLLAVSCWLLAIGTIGAIRVIGSLISNLQSPFTYLYREIRPILFFLEYPRGYFSFSTWASKNSFEVSFDSSEVSFHSSEVLFRAHVENFLFPRGHFEISTWKSLFPDTVP